MIADAITLTDDRVSIQSNHQHFLFKTLNVTEILDKPLSHVDTMESYIDLLPRKLNEELHSRT